MPTPKKSRVSSRSGSLKNIRLGSAVVPEVRRVTTRATSPWDTQSMRW